MPGAMMSAYPDAFSLARDAALARLLGDHRDFLIIGGIGNSANDVATITRDGDNVYALAGAMGGASTMGLGLALARPDKMVLVVTGDGELMMSLGSLATIAVLNPANLSIICVDNGRYLETGNQLGHTGRGVDLEVIARGAGFKATMVVTNDSQIASAARLLRSGGNAKFVLLSVSDKETEKFPRNMDAASCRNRFKAAFPGRRSSSKELMPGDR